MYTKDEVVEGVVERILSEMVSEIEEIMDEKIEVGKVDSDYRNIKEMVSKINENVLRKAFELDYFFGTYYMKSDRDVVLESLEESHKDIVDLLRNRKTDEVIDLLKSEYVSMIEMRFDMINDLDVAI